jgi:hypothetical protein
MLVSTSSTGGGFSVGEVRLRTKGHGVCLLSMLMQHSMMAYLGTAGNLHTHLTTATVPVCLCDIGCQFKVSRVFDVNHEHNTALGL